MRKSKIERSNKRERERERERGGERERGEREGERERERDRERGWGAFEEHTPSREGHLQGTEPSIERQTQTFLC